MKLKLGVIFGGATVEHEVSIITAVQAMENLDKEKYDIIPIYIDKERNWYTGKLLKDINVYKNFDDLKKYAKKCILYNKSGNFVLQSIGLFKKILTDIDIVLPIVHGNNVEDGTLAGFLEMLGVPYVGSRIIGSALGQDKVIQKQVLHDAGLPVVDYIWFYDNEYFIKKDEIINNIEKLKYPVIVKPATLGSSIGIKIAKTREELIEAINDAIKYDNKIIVEETVKNLLEVNCAVLGNYEFQETSLIAQMKLKNAILTFDDKYIGNGKGSQKSGAFKKASTMDNADFKIPAELDENLTNEIHDLAKKTFTVLNLNGVARIDFLIDDKTQKVYINEPNTIPGSLAFYLFDKNVKNYTKLLDELITLAIKDYKKHNKKITSFDNNILSTYNSNSSLKGSKKI
ncbi:MAG: D-alanine--D-alanine ligase [Bacilli bacterium]|nr:D-alanine--D-alanine ligase [Bacilli bacterium]